MKAPYEPDCSLCGGVNIVHIYIHLPEPVVTNQCIARVFVIVVLLEHPINCIDVQSCLASFLYSVD